MVSEPTTTTQATTDETVSTVFVIGCSLAGFFVSAVGAFSLFFYRMGAVPVWHQGSVSQVTAVLATPPPKIDQAPASLSMRGLATPRPDTLRTPASAKLPAPVLLSPLQDTVLKPGLGSLELKWAEVPGAHRYHVHAWQMHEGDETTLLDEDTDVTSAVIEPVHRVAIQWEVQAFEESGTPGNLSATSIVQVR